MEEASGWGAAWRRRRAALLTAAAVPVLVLVGLPVADVHWAAVAGAASMWTGFIVSFDLLTATLLLGLYRQGAGFRLLVLATAFLWSASVVVMLAFATRDVIVSEPTLAAEASGWLWLYLHLGPSLLFGLALMPWTASWQGRLDGPAPSWRRALSVVGTILLLGPGLLLLVLLAAPSALPSVVATATGEFPAWLMVLVLVVTVGSVAISTKGVVQRGAASGIEAWALVAAVAWLGEVVFAFTYEDRFTVAYYGARLLATAASAAVLGAILSEVLNLRQRLIAGNADLEGQINALLEAQQLREHVSAVVSHDMRAPIAGIQGYLEILDHDEVDPAFVRRIHQRCLVLVKRLSLLTEDLQAAALATNGDLEVLPELLDVETQLIECSEGFPGLDLRMDCQPGLVAWADPLRLQQILANLIRNAEKHGAEPIYVRVAAEPDGMIVFRVSDQGPGVPETFIPRLFERYSQGPDHAPGGSGLGLSVAHDLVRAHHGAVRYDLTDPAFIVTLPAAPTEIRTPMGRVISPPRRLGLRTRAIIGSHAEDAG